MARVSYPASPWSPDPDPAGVPAPVELGEPVTLALIRATASQSCTDAARTSPSTSTSGNRPARRGEPPCRRAPGHQPSADRAGAAQRGRSPVHPRRQAGARRGPAEHCRPWWRARRAGCSAAWDWCPRVADPRLTRTVTEVTTCRDPLRAGVRAPARPRARICNTYAIALARVLSTVIGRPRNFRNLPGQGPGEAAGGLRREGPRQPHRGTGVTPPRAGRDGLGRRLVPASPCASGTARPSTRAPSCRRRATPTAGG